MERKKIFIIGSAGFLMSNFTRYLLYRTKDYEIISVDDIGTIGKKKRIYFNTLHKYYPSGLNRESLINIIKFENPDMIINGLYSPKQLFSEIMSFDVNKVLYSLGYGEKTIHIEGRDHYDEASNVLEKSASKFILKSGGTVIKIPNIIGMREDNVRGSIRFTMFDLLNSKQDSKAIINDTYPTAYAEDLASLIWYVMEKEIKGSVLMPKLGDINTIDIAHTVNEVSFNNEKEILMVDEGEIFHTDYDDLKSIDGWIPDSTSIEDVIKNTVAWYNSNPWALWM